MTKEMVKGEGASCSKKGRQLGYAHTCEVIEAIYIALYIFDVFLRHPRQSSQYVLYAEVSRPNSNVWWEYHGCQCC